MRYLDFVRLMLVCAISLLGAGNASAGDHSSTSTGENIKPAALYHNYCSVCHGDRGDGNSRARWSLIPPPRDFTSAVDLGREAMVAFVTHGKPGTAMVGWKTQLTATEIEAVVDYIRQVFMVVAADPRLQRGKMLYVHNCAACHGDRGQAMFSQSGSGSAPSRNLSSPQASVDLSRERMITAVTQGHSGTAIADLTKRLLPQDIDAVVDYVRAALMMPATGDISGTQAHGGRGGDAIPSKSSSFSSKVSPP